MLKTQRVGIQELNKLSAIKFLQLLKYFQEELKGILTKKHIKISEKIDGLGLRFGLNKEGKFFIESSRSEPVYNIGDFEEYTKNLKNVSIFQINRAKHYDDILKLLKNFKQLQEVLKKYNNKKGIKIIGECLYIPLAELKDNKIKFVNIYYDKNKLADKLTFIIFDIIDSEGKQYDNKEKIIKDLKEISNKNIKFTDSLINFDKIDLTIELNNINDLLKNYDNVIKILKSRKKELQMKKQEIIKLIEELKEKISKKILSLLKPKFGDEFEGVVIELLNKSEKYKIISDIFKTRFKEKQKRFKENFNFIKFKKFLQEEDITKCLNISLLSFLFYLHVF